MTEKKTKTSVDNRTLTAKDREKLRRLLTTAKPENARLAFDLTETICSPPELQDIYTDGMITLLVSTGDIELFAITAGFCLRHQELWKRFLVCATDSRVLQPSTAGFYRVVEREKTISPEIARYLASNESRGSYASIRLNKITTLPDESAEFLASYEGSLELSGLTCLSDAAAESLSKQKGELSLYGLLNLSDAAAEGLAKHKGDLHLSGLTSLSDKAAKSLGQHKGHLDLSNLKTVSTEGLAALGKTKTITSSSNQKEKHVSSILVNKSIATKMRAAVKNSRKQPTTLDRKKIAEIKSLLKSALAPKEYNTAQSTWEILSQKQRKKRVNEIKVACEMLVAANASEGDWLAVFTKTKIRTLLGTWEPEIFNILTLSMKPSTAMYELLKLETKKRINTNSSDYEVHRRYDQYLTQIVEQASPGTIALLKNTGRRRFTEDVLNRSD